MWCWCSTTKKTSSKVKTYSFSQPHRCTPKHTPSSDFLDSFSASLCTRQHSRGCHLRFLMGVNGWCGGEASQPAASLSSSVFLLLPPTSQQPQHFGERWQTNHKQGFTLFSVTSLWGTFSLQVLRCFQCRRSQGICLRTYSEQSRGIAIKIHKHGGMGRRRMLRLMNKIIIQGLGVSLYLWLHVYRGKQNCSFQNIH